MYGDRIFMQMMFAKVFVVQMINMQGYDVLFQDVDITWYRHPLEVFHDESHSFSEFDIIFQDDGAHSNRYAPYSANSGFYYVRHNDKTRYLFVSLLYSGEMIFKTKSHQETLITLLAEYQSLFGLRVKVISLDDPDFPGGWHYHRRKDFMRQIAKEEIVPTIFHMSWTQNKKNKLLFMKQMGMWYLKDQCIDKPLSEISPDENGVISFVETCCSKEPIVSCHYRDKPSIIPCNDSPNIDKGRPSFW